MEGRRSVDVTAGAGVDGDRYEVVSVEVDGENFSRSRGKFSGTRIPDSDRAVSIISATGIKQANELLASEGLPDIELWDTRRNIVVDDITSDELNELVFRQFYIAGILFTGTDLCEPCKRPTQLIRGVRDEVHEEASEIDRQFIRAFKGTGGIRAMPLGSGAIFKFDHLTIERINERRWL